MIGIPGTIADSALTSAISLGWSARWPCLDPLCWFCVVHERTRCWSLCCFCWPKRNQHLLLLPLLTQLGQICGSKNGQIMYAECAPHGEWHLRVLLLTYSCCCCWCSCLMSIVCTSASNRPTGSTTAPLRKLVQRLNWLVESLGMRTASEYRETSTSHHPYQSCL